MTAFARRGSLALVLGLALAVLGCSRQEEAKPPAPGAASNSFSVLAGSEVRDLEPALLAAAREAGIELKLAYAGTLDIVERVNAGEDFDAVLPASGAYPALALTSKPLAREKLFYSRVAIGVKAAKLKALGWDRTSPSWADIARAAAAGQLRYAMTNPSSSNSGMSAIFAVASAVAGKTEDLSVQDVDAKVLTAFLQGQKLTAGSSGWLADAYVKAPGGLDAMVNYESVILRANARLAPADQLTLVYPQDGVISADHPLMLLKEARRSDFAKLVGAIKSDAFQRQAAAGAYLRPSIQGVPLASGLAEASAVELSFPNRLEVIDAVLDAFQSRWRRPATSIFVLDVSGSMKGPRLEAMRSALKVLAGADATAASARYARFQSRERVVLIDFAEVVGAPVQVDFPQDALASARQRVITYADGLTTSGGTGIYAALLQAQEVAMREMQRDADRFVSVVLLTDGENNTRPDLAEWRQRYAAGAQVRVFPILYGEASNADMASVAELSGGRVFDGRKTALATVFRDIRGYQ